MGRSWGAVAYWKDGAYGAYGARGGYGRDAGKRSGKANAYVSCSVCRGWVWESRIDAAAKGNAALKCECGTAFSELRKCQRDGDDAGGKRGADASETACEQSELSDVVRKVLEALQALKVVLPADMTSKVQDIITVPLEDVLERTKPKEVPPPEKTIEELRKASGRARGELEQLRQGILAGHRKLAKAEEGLALAKEQLEAKEVQLRPLEEAAEQTEIAYNRAVEAAGAAARTAAGARPAARDPAAGAAAMGYDVPVPDTDEAAAHLKRVLGQYEEKRAKRACGEADAAGAVAAARASADAARAAAAGS